MTGTNPVEVAAGAAGGAPAATAAEAAAAAPAAPSATATESPAPAAATEAAPAAAEAAPALASTLLGEAPAQEPVAAAEAPAEAPADPPVEAQSDEPAQLATFEPFQLPDGVTLEPEKVGNFTGLLADLESKGKIDHAEMQVFGQKAVDLFVSEVRGAVEADRAANVAWWETQKTAWKDAFLADPEIGGPRAQTTLASARQAIENHGGTPEQKTELRQLLNQSGYGNHPVLIRFLARLGSANSEGRPLPAAKPMPTPKSKTQTLYGNSMGAGR